MNRPAPSSIRVWRRTRLALAAALAGAAGVAQVRPDYAAAAAFGHELQRDYAARKSRAITARLDSGAMMQRVFGRGSRAEPGFELVERLWAEQALPSVVRGLGAYDVFENIHVGRVALLEGARALECALLRPDGAFHLVTLLLAEAAPGAVGIEDLRFASAPLETARAMRHELLLRRAPLPGVLEEEEVVLASHGRAWHGTVAQALGAMAGGDPEGAFRIWNGLPADVKTTRIWLEHRNRMAFNGGAAAMAQLQAEARAGGGGPPAVRFSLALAAGDRGRALAALDEFIVAERGLPFLRTVKADLLLGAGRWDDALALARDIGALSPATAGAHAVAYRAAAALGRAEAAAEALTDWARLAPAAAIIATVEADGAPGVAAFRGTPEYAAWRRRAEAPPFTAPPGPAR